MMGAASKSLAAGTRVKVTEPMAVPADSIWDRCERTSTSVKKRLQQLFFSGDRRVSGSVVYIVGETERARLKRKEHVKVELRDAGGSAIVITAPISALRAA
jgi:hypothetical protein